MTRIKRLSRTWDDSRGSAAERGYDSHWHKFRNTYLRAHPLCSDCGKPSCIVHHVRPLADGGDKYDVDNLKALCLDCHARIHSSDGGKGGCDVNGDPVDATHWWTLK